jgi:hypothetical protein
MAFIASPTVFELNSLPSIAIRAEKLVPEQEYQDRPGANEQAEHITRRSKLPRSLPAGGSQWECITDPIGSVRIAAIAILLRFGV